MKNQLVDIGSMIFTTILIYITHLILTVYISWYPIKIYKILLFNNENLFFMDYCPHYYM